MAKLQYKPQAHREISGNTASQHKVPAPDRPTTQHNTSHSLKTASASPHDSHATNAVVLAFAHFPFQYWRDADALANGDVSDTAIIQSHILDNGDAVGPSAQQLAHLERTRERAAYYKELQEYLDRMNAERERRSELSDEQLLREKYEAARGVHVEVGEPRRPIPPVSKYAR